MFDFRKIFDLRKLNRKFTVAYHWHIGCQLFDKKSCHISLDFCGLDDSKKRKEADWYSFDNVATSLIQISRLYYFGFFSKTNQLTIR